jgi:PKD repeat protein
MAQTFVVKEKNDKLYLWIEAEAGKIIDPMLTLDAEEASGGQYIEVRGGNNNIDNPPNDGLAFYEFTVKNARTYKIWGRVGIDMHDEDAFWVKIDDDNWVKWKGIEVGCKWHWDEVHDTQKNGQVMAFSLDAGPHTLALTYGMDQTRLDKWLITNDLEYIPMEAGPRAEAIIKQSSEMPVANESIRFDGSASFSTEGSITYSWDLGNGKMIPAATADHTFTAAGEYPVKLVVTDDAGLSGRLTKIVRVYSKEPVARIKYSPDRPEANEAITFDASGSYNARGEIVSYFWDFGDGASGSGISAKHAFDAPGEYYTTLTVADNAGNVKSETRLVTVITGVPKKVIYETDMCLDADDVGALAMLHGLANNNEVDLLAVCFNEVHPGGAAAIDAMNTWYGRGDIPVGIYKKDLPDPDESYYLDALIKFPHDLDHENAPSALDVYKNVLSKQPDKSVTIISVGFIVNLYDLLLEEPDLIARKVAELVIMGGPGGGGFNLARHNTGAATQYLLANWPTPIVFTGAGTGIYTGAGLDKTPVENPIREAYYNFFNSNFCGRHSWDQISVLYGVRGISDYFTNLGSVDRWNLGPGMRSSFKTRLTKDEYARIIEDLMVDPPSLLIARNKKPVKIIYETDMCVAADDVGALAMIHGLQNRGEAELLAVCLNATGDPDGVAAIDAINTWYGRGDIPVGIWKGPYPDPDTSKYFHALTRFPHDLDSKSAPGALEVYREVLVKQPDHSVTIISTGFLQNLDELLRNEPALVAAKVKELVLMGAHQNDVMHFNWHNTSEAAQNVIENWPSPLVFHHLGGGVMTGSGLKDTPEGNPVRMAYYLQLGSRFVDNPSYDQITVLYGVRGASGYFKQNTTGLGMLTIGYKWDMGKRGDSWLELLLPEASYTAIINDLMLKGPVK